MNVLVVKHSALASTLQMVFQPFPFVVGAAETAGRGDIIVTTTADMAPAACRPLATRGVLVVVLSAALPAQERAAYLAAGVFRYLEMTADTSALNQTIEDASSKERSTSGPTFLSTTPTSHA